MTDQEEEQKPDKYQRVTKAQFELWLINPVTINYLKCLQFEIEQVDDLLIGSKLVDSASHGLNPCLGLVMVGRECTV